VLYLLAQSIAGAAHGLYGQIRYIWDQAFPDTAGGEALERWGNNYGVPRRDPSFAEGEVIVTGADSAAVPLGAELVRADGAAFEVTEGINLTEGTGVVQVRATASGVESNTAAGAELSFSEPVLDVDGAATVSPLGLGGGADLEDDDQLRDRVIQRLRSPGQGGNAQDYVRWALEVPGVTRAFCFPVFYGLGTVGVGVMRDLDEDPFPQGPALVEIQAYIDDRRPVAMVGVTVFAPTPVPVDLTIQLEPDTPAIRAGVEAALGELIYSEGAAAPRQASSSLALSRIQEAISSADGERSHVLVAPVAAPVVLPGQLLTLGAISWV
jgi:uncharacterized phage protein gp47/JayE